MRLSDLLIHARELRRARKRAGQAKTSREPRRRRRRRTAKSVFVDVPNKVRKRMGANR